jgi:hypothetical protein
MMTLAKPVGLFFAGPHAEYMGITKLVSILMDTGSYNSAEGYIMTRRYS